MARNFRKLFGSDDSGRDVDGRGRKSNRFGFNLDTLESFLDGEERRRRREYDDHDDDGYDARRRTEHDMWDSDDDGWDRHERGTRSRERRFEEAFDF